MTWSLANSWVYSTNVAQVDFTGLAAYSDIDVLARNTTCTVSNFRSVRVSTDNGSTFMSTSGQYQRVDDAGVETADTEMRIFALASTAARGGHIEICGFNLTTPKVAQLWTRTGSEGRTILIPTASPLNALRVVGNGTPGLLSGGSIYIFGRQTTPPWKQVGAWAYSTNVAQADFTGLAGYNEVRIVVKEVGSTLSGTTAVRVSTDNGATFLSASGDYVSIINDGSEVANTELQLYAATITGNRSGEIEIRGLNLAAPKIVERVHRITDMRTAVIPTTSTINAVRVFNTAGLLTGFAPGTVINVYAR